MIQIREFTKQGIEELTKYLTNLNNPTEICPPELNHEPFSREINSQEKVEIDEKKIFKTRMEIGKYLIDVFNDTSIKRSEIIGMDNMWTWFAYIWLKQLCPEKNGLFKIYSLPLYICSSSWSRYYRHLIALPYFMYSLHGGDSTKLFLNCPPYLHNDFTEQLASNQNIISSENVVKVIHELYWDANLNKPKVGALSKDKNDPGTVRRLRSIFNQFRMTYDLNGMKTDRILELLPSEFKVFMKK
jgi:hypothetical protein